MHLEISNFRESPKDHNQNSDQQLSAKLFADSQPKGLALVDFQPYLPGLHPICSSPLPRLSIGDDAMDHRMAIHSWQQARKAAQCFDSY